MLTGAFRIIMLAKLIIFPYFYQKLAKPDYRDCRLLEKEKMKLLCLDYTIKRIIIEEELSRFRFLKHLFLPSSRSCLLSNANISVNVNFVKYCANIYCAALNSTIKMIYKVLKTVIITVTVFIDNDVNWGDIPQSIWKCISFHSPKFDNDTNS
ncbi:hypothetical protein X798_04647 [Onchocerca flexuosa]|uniref:Uncharacterized protein n=1 Tax=Onchocerca flexuosa TaxID=387005 RepID=A0A238BTR9_9BILA|nr:hypothetical protein X798_04647 [Onchocerca flexuosa]